MLGVRRKRRLDDQEQNVSKRSKSSSSSSSSSVIIIDDDESQPIVPMVTKVDQFIDGISSFFRKLFGRPRKRNYPPSKRQNHAHQLRTQSNPSISLSDSGDSSKLTNVSREQLFSYKSYTIEEEDRGPSMESSSSQSTRSNMRYTRSDGRHTEYDSFLTSQTRSDSDFTGLPIHPSPFQSTPLLHDDFPFKKYPSKTVKSSKESATKKKAHRSNSVLERVTREREDAMFREMINGMTISTPTTTTTTTLHTAAAAATDSIESLSTSTSDVTTRHTPSFITPLPVTSKSSAIHLYSSYLSQYPHSSHSTKHRPHPSLGTLAPASLSPSTSSYNPSLLIKPDSNTRHHSSVSDPEVLSFGWGKTTPQLVAMPRSETTPRLMTSPSNLLDAIESNWLEKFSKAQVSKFADHKTRIETYKKYNEIYRKERIEAEDRRNTKQIEKFNNLILRPWTPSLEVEDEESELTLDLPEDLAATVDNVWAYDTYTGEVLAERKNIRITRADLLTLKGLEWLNDEVINFYLTLVVDTVNDSNDRKVYLFNSFFYPKIMSAGYSGVRRWTKKVDIFSYDLIILPVHLGMHWCLAMIDFKRKTICYYDSLKCSNKKCLQVLRDYIVSESLSKRSIEYDVSDWTLECCENIPDQHNGSDCGVFTCMYARHLARDKPLNFSQADMSAIRRMMVAEIVSKQLLHAN